MSRIPVRVAVAFALVSFFWGSTFLAIGIAVKDLPPALLAGSRFTIAGLAMLGWCAVSGERVAITRRDFARLAAAGILLLTFGNVLLSWAEQIVPTGIAALLATTIPLWILVIDTFVLRGDRLSRGAYAGFALGLCGVALLLWPRIVAAGTLGTRELVGCAAVLGSSLAWAIGSIVSRRRPAAVPSFTAIGWQMVIAGATDLTIAALAGDPARAHWTARAVGAIAYLAVFGSLVGYTAYIWLLAHVPVSKAGTYAYINPIIAVVLGRVVLGEPITMNVLAGSAVILAAVAMATRPRLHGTLPKPAVERVA